MSRWVWNVRLLLGAAVYGFLDKPLPRTEPMAPEVTLIIRDCPPDFEQELQDEFSRLLYRIMERYGGRLDGKPIRIEFTRSGNVGAKR